MTTNRRDLLDQLRIDRSEDEQAGPAGRPWLMAAVGFAAGLVVTGTGAFVLWPSAPAPAASVAKPSTPAAPASGPAAPASASVLTGSGYVTARRVATVSAEITGRVVQILVEEGMAVTEGQVIAQLDTTLAEIDLSVLEAGARAADATADDAERQLERLRGLPSGAVVSRAELTAAEARAKSARANAELAAEQVRRQQALLAKYTVRAPFAGVVTRKDAQPGEIVSPVAAGGGSTRTGLATIVDMTSLEIEVDVNEAFISRVQTGQKVEAALDAYPDWRIPARVAAVIPAADRSKATVKVRIAFDVRDPRVLPDMAAKVSFLDEQAAAPAGGAR